MKKCIVYVFYVSRTVFRQLAVECQTRENLVALKGIEVAVDCSSRVTYHSGRATASHTMIGESLHRGMTGLFRVIPPLTAKGNEEKCAIIFLIFE